MMIVFAAAPAPQNAGPGPEVGELLGLHFAAMVCAALVHPAIYDSLFTLTLIPYTTSFYCAVLLPTL